MEDGTKDTPIVYIDCVDTLQYSFASHLSVEFRRKGISAFVNSKGTLDVIERAGASVVVFSKYCLSSTSRLDKLVKVLHCQRKNGLVVVPVFYCISPSDVVILEHESSCSVDQIRKWRSALQEMRELHGHQFREECSECEFVEEIVKDVYKKLFPMEQIGINSRLLEIEQLLCKQPWGIRRIGIWGMPGIGKTTLAQAFFDQISGRYEASCFIKHFDKAFHEKGLHRLLEEYFGKILKELPRACSSMTRPSLPGDKISKKRTLVVLDDVQNPLVAESFLGGFHWFGPGSLIVITSRDKQVFRLCQINYVYEVQSLKENEALQLFSQCAFGKDIREQKLLKLSMKVIDYANGNPFALRFYGRELKGKKLSEMETIFLKLKLRTPYKIYDLFKSSYETLNDNEKNIFLDIACFFNGDNVDYVLSLLEGCGLFPHVGIEVLVDKCLVSISENRVNMHNLIQDFGRERINGETVQIERRRRLWEPWVIKYLLEDDKLDENGDPKATYTHALGTEDIEGIFLDTSNLLFDVKPTAFNMRSLRFLKIYCSRYEKHYGVRLTKGLKFLPSELRLLHWESYPLQSLPQYFDPCHLVELNMSYSQLQKLWGGTKNLEMLKTVKLCHSEQLNEVDDVCKAQNIELIDLRGCTKLQNFPATGQLQHLRVVNLSGCTEIRSFPEVSSNIEELHLQGTGISELPISIGTLSPQDKLNLLSNLLTEFSGFSNALNLEKLTSLVQVVSSNQLLDKLVVLNMKDCSHLQSLPHMVDLESLKVLHLSGCSQLKVIQSFPRNLKELYLAGTAVEELPQLPRSIEILDAHNCVSLISVPFDFEQLLRYYTFSNCFALSAQVVSEFVKNALTTVERIVREYQQELNKSLDFSFTVPSPAITYDLQPGSSVMIQLDSSWRSTLGFAILVEVSFSNNYHEASGFFVSCVCRWKDKEFVSHRLEKSFHCLSLGEEVMKDHMFVFGDLNMYPSTCEGNDLGILSDVIVFEFCTMNKHKKLLDESCRVKKCGVHVITAANGDSSSIMDQPFSSSDYQQDFLDNEDEEVLRIIYDGLDENDRNLILYIACLFNDEEADFLEPRIASIGFGISYRLKVLANKFLIHISPFGVIVQHGLLQIIGREIDNRQSTRPGGGDFGWAFEVQKWVQALSDVANITRVDSWEWENEANVIENLPHSFKMHSSMCLELKKLVDRIMRILPEIEPRSSSGIQILCLFNRALEKAKQLLQYCSESSKLYMAVTGDAILSRGSRAKNSLEQYLTDIRTMVPTVLDIKIAKIVQDLRSTVLTLDSSDEEAGKAIRELMKQSTSSSVSSEEGKEFHYAALKLQISTPEAVTIERRSLKSLVAKLSEYEGNKRQILKYLLALLKKHERIICRDHKENPSPMHQTVDATLPQQFKCPLSLTVMFDPVVISSGYTFERMWIQKWLDEGNDSCPISKRRLDDFTLRPNVGIKNQISTWCSKHDISVSSIASFEISRYNIPDLSCFSMTDLNSSYSSDSPSYFKISKGGYFSTESESGTGTADSTVNEMEIDPLCGLTSLPWDAQSKLMEDVRSHFERNTLAFRLMSPRRFLEPLIAFLKNAHERNGSAADVIKIGLDLLLAFINRNSKAIESLEEDAFNMFSVFLESEVVIAEEALKILEVLSNHPQSLSKITSAGSLSSLLKIAESGTEHLQELAMITLKNLSSSNEICLEMVSLDFVKKLTSFLQGNVFSKHSIVILRNLLKKCEKGRVCITETPGCLASIAELLDSNVPEEQETAISILLQLCVQKMEYCYLVVREGVEIYSSLFLISKNGTEEAKIGASELLRALEEVDSNREEEEATVSTTSQVVTHEESIVTTPSSKKIGLFGSRFSSLKRKKDR